MLFYFYANTKFCFDLHCKVSILVTNKESLNLKKNIQNCMNLLT